MPINLIEKGYNETNAVNPGESFKLPAGGYVCRVVNVEFVYSKKNLPMLELYLDITEGEFKNYFTESTRRRKQFNSGLRWEPNGIYRQTILTADDKVSSFFKGLLTLLVKDNPNANVKLDAFDYACFFGAMLGFVFAEEEYDFNGYSGVRVVPKFPKSIEDIRNGNFKIPELKRSPESSSNTSDNDFGGTPVSKDDTPF